MYPLLRPFAVRNPDRRISAIEVRAPAGVEVVAVRLPPGPVVCVRRFGHWLGACLPSGWEWPEVIEGEALYLSPSRLGLEVEARPVSDAPGPNGLFEGVPTARLQALEIASIHASDDASLSADAAYFHALDLCSHPNLLERTHSRDDLLRQQSGTARVEQYLIRRLNTRWSGGSAAACEPPAEFAGIAGMMEGLIRTHYPSVQAEPGAASLVRAFTRFGLGDLRLMFALDASDGGPALAPGVAPGMSNGGPNGAMVFLFAEFCLAAVDVGMSPALWSCAAPAFVSAAESYMLTHTRWADSGPESRNFNDPLHHGRAQPARRLCELSRTALVEHYARMDLGAATTRFERMLKCVFTDVTSEEEALLQTLHFLEPGPRLVGHGQVTFPILPTLHVPDQAWW